MWIQIIEMEKKRQKISLGFKNPRWMSISKMFRKIVCNYYTKSEMLNFTKFPVPGNNISRNTVILLDK